MEFPVGYFEFHKNKFLNYQFNRWYSSGYTALEDLRWAADRSGTYQEYVSAFLDLADRARQEHRLQAAAFYLRAAEFLMEPDDPRKLPLYRDFREVFDEAFREEGFIRRQVSYQGGFLPVLELPARAERSRGVLLACGGFDSFVEEFFGIWQSFAEAGYRVLAFEGPGQGGALRLSGLTFEHDWENPTAAVLDHFGLDEVTFLGVSMGGYWCLRAAAFEKRIQRVIAFPPVYDWLEMAPGPIRGLVNLLMRFPKLMNLLAGMKRSDPRMNQIIQQAIFISGGDQALDAVRWMLGMNQDHLNSKRVTQDVLLLGGENDAFQPPVLLNKQAEALTAARSLTTRIFTREEEADQHCQMGNLGLAVEVMLDWLEEIQPSQSR